MVPFMPVDPHSLFEHCCGPLTHTKCNRVAVCFNILICGSII